MQQLPALFKNREKKLIPFIVAHYPDKKSFWEFLVQLDATRCDAVEVGIPFSDPVADGPVIQECYQRVLKKGFLLEEFFSQLELIKRYLQVPLIIMSYLNPILQFGVDNFAGRAKKAGVEGLLIVDLPAEQILKYRKLFNGSGINKILLIAPTTSTVRARYIARKSNPFVYLVSHLGVTGSKMELNQEFFAMLQRINNCCHKPICLGFGIENSQQARRLAEYVDGLIVGSALLRIIGSDSESALENGLSFLKDLKEALQWGGAKN